VEISNYSNLVQLKAHNAGPRRFARSARGRHSLLAIRECLSDSLSCSTQCRPTLRESWFQKSMPTSITPASCRLNRYRSERKMIGRLHFSRVVNITSRGEPLYLPIKHGYAVSLCRPLPAPLGTKVPCSPSQSRKTGNLELASP